MMRFLADERGTTAIEYGLIGVLLSVAIIGAVSLLGDGVQASFENTSAKVTAATNN